MTNPNVDFYEKMQDISGNPNISGLVTNSIKNAKDIAINAIKSGKEVADELRNASVKENIKYGGKKSLKQKYKKNKNVKKRKTNKKGKKRIIK
jgi:hypothetical protein